MTYKEGRASMKATDMLGVNFGLNWILGGDEFLKFLTIFGDGGLMILVGRRCRVED